MIPRKICIVGPGLNMGGVERASTNIANYLAETGNRVSFITIFKHNHFFNIDERVSIVEPGDFNISRLSILKTIRYLRRNIIKESPDTILAYTKIYSSLVLLSLTRTKFKVYISERSSPLYRWPMKIEMLFKLACFFKKPAGAIAQTKIASQFQHKYFKGKVSIKVIPNSLREITLFPNVARQRTILAFGRLNDYTKGFDLLIDAFNIAKIDHWSLVFAGGDGDRSLLKKKVDSYGLSEKVIFLGAVKDIDLELAKAGIFVIPSRTEGFPNALCEAMAAGLPCISFNFIAGPDEIITNFFDGILIENGNINELAKALNNLANNTVERLILGQNALKIRERYDFRKIGLEYLEFITKHL